jgi:predicted phosphodiesterase
MLKTTTARQYRTKYPDKPTLALARVMYGENKKLFSNVDDARSTLRYIEGKIGEKNKKSVSDKSLVLEGERPKNPYNLPSSDEASYKPFVFSGHKRVAIFSDIHIPYHSIDAITVALDFCKKEKPDALLLNGDALDFHTLSRFEKDPRKKNFALELDTFKATIEVFKKVLKCKIYFKIGNHEERYEKYLQQKAGELNGVTEFDFENILKARAEGIEVIGDKRIMKLNDLNGIHGHEFINGSFSPVNIARGLYTKAKVSAFQGHNHQTSEHTEPDMNGKIITTWSLGCMCELHPAYMPLNKWNLGFAVVDLDSNGHDYEFRNKRIYKGKVL